MGATSSSDWHARSPVSRKLGRNPLQSESSALCRGAASPEVTALRSVGERVSQSTGKPAPHTAYGQSNFNRLLRQTHDEFDMVHAGTLPI